MTFNAALFREKALGLLEMDLNRTVPEGGPSGNFGKGDITSCVDHSLVGYGDRAKPIIVRANSWIDQGLASKEYERFGGADQHRSNLHKARALGTWLEGCEFGRDELVNHHWNEARRFMETDWRGAALTRQEIIRDGLDDYMAMSVLGGVFEDYKHGKEPFEAGIDMYEHWVGKQDISLKKTLKSRELGYILCRHYLNNEFDREEILQAGRKMLAAKLSQPQPYCDGWLENGQSLRAAMWLMLIYWYPAFHNGEELPSPVDVLLKAYDDMPDVIRPF
jgi:hypothetical protein